MVTPSAASNRSAPPDWKSSPGFRPWPPAAASCAAANRLVYPVFRLRPDQPLGGVVEASDSIAGLIRVSLP